MRVFDNDFFYILCEPFGEYQTNCYLVFNKTKKEALIVDPGIGASTWIIDTLKNTNAIPLAILNTHGHFDHVWSNAELLEQKGILAKYANTPFISNPKRIYLYLGNTSNQKYVDMMKSISRKLQSKDNKFTGDFVEYEIMLNKLPENAEYYVDIHGFGKDYIYTESYIPIESIRDSEDKAY